MNPTKFLISALLLLQSLSHADRIGRKLPKGAPKGGHHESDGVYQSASSSNLCKSAASLEVSNETPVVSMLLDIAEDTPSCVYYDGLPSAWYTVVGNGEVLTLSTCSPDTNVYGFLAIMEGACSGLDSATTTTLACATSSSYTLMDMDDCQDTSLATGISWQSEVDTTYYILASSEVQGTLGVTVSGETPIPNDSCLNAVEYDLDAGETVVGSTVGAHHDYSADADQFLLGDCREFLTAPGVWFTVTAVIDGQLTASTCYPGTDYKATLSIFEDGCGDNISCVATVEEEEGCHTVTWDVAAGQTFRVLVSGFGAHTSGAFELKIE